MMRVTIVANVFPKKIVVKLRARVNEAVILVSFLRRQIAGLVRPAYPHHAIVFGTPIPKTAPISSVGRVS